MKKWSTRTKLLVAATLIVTVPIGNWHRNTHTIPRSKAYADFRKEILGTHYSGIGTVGETRLTWWRSGYIGGSATKFYVVLIGDQGAREFWVEMNPPVGDNGIWRIWRFEPLRTPPTRIQSPERETQNPQR